MNAELIKAKVAPNRIGWYALRHRDGWYVGTDDGVTCYADHDLARAALTIAWQRDGGRRVNFKIVTYIEPSIHLTGEYTPQKTAIEAIHSYEQQAKFNH